MTKQSRTAQCASILLAVLFAATACGGAGNGDYTGHGIVKGVEPARREVTIDHEEIPGLMKAMTMTFRVSDSHLLKGVEPGQEVEFDVVYEEGAYQVTAIRAHGG